MQSCAPELMGCMCFRGEETQRMEARSPRVRTFTKACAVCSLGLSEGKESKDVPQGLPSQLCVPHLLLGLSRIGLTLL